MKARKEIRKFIVLYAIHLLGWYIFITILATSRGQSFGEATGMFFELFTFSSFLIGFHIFFVLLYGLYQLIRYFIRVYKNYGRRVFWKRLGLRLALPALLIFGSFKTLVIANENEEFTFEWDDSVYNETGYSKDLYRLDGKQRGMSVFGWREDNNAAVDELVKNNIEWVAVVPFFYQRDEMNGVVNTRDSYKNWSRRDSMFIENIALLKSKKIRVHLKPHLWMRDGWRSNIGFDTSDGWDAWFETYRINMLHYARMAEKSGAELFCVGTELKTSIKQQPEKWKELISEIKEVYKGELTYAANWHDEYEYIAFWDQLDYIGIQAYFPLTNRKNPELQTIMDGWEPHMGELKAFSEKYQKPILFTEVGYKSDASATIKPWEWSRAINKLIRQKSDRTQQLAYEALFQKLWQEDWFAGIYIWEWDFRSTHENTANDMNFSPRFKPAENTMAKWFGKSPKGSILPLLYLDTSVPARPGTPP